MAFDSASGLWLGGRSGIEQLDPATAERRRILQTKDGIAIGNVRGILLSTDHTIWAVSSHGLWRVSTSSGQADQVAGDVLEDLYSIHESQDHSILVGSKLGLHRIDPISGKATLLWVNDGSNAIGAIVEDRVGKVWMSVRGRGLANLDPQSGQAHWIRSDRFLRGSLPPSEVTTLLVDQSGLLWVGSDALGSEQGGSARGDFPFHRRSRARRATRARPTISAPFSRTVPAESGSAPMVTDSRATRAILGKFEYHDAAIARAFEVAFPARIQIEALAEDQRRQDLVCQQPRHRHS